MKPYYGLTPSIEEDFRCMRRDAMPEDLPMIEAFIAGQEAERLKRLKEQESQIP